MPQESFDELLKFFKVLGNESRLKIIGLLANREHSVGELAELLEIKEPTVSHHLSMMKQLRLVQMRGAGNVHYYRLDVSFLESMSRDVFSQSNLASLVEQSQAMTPEEKVLRQYVEDGRIKEIPARHKKRDIVLAWLAEQFEFGVRYAEPDLNKLLNAYHPDHAALRRYLVEYRYMKRERGIYWRVENKRMDWG